MQHHPSLLRRLTTTDAVVIGLGSMIGAGVFAAFAPAARAAVHPTYRVPHHAEITLAIVVSAIVLVADLRGVIGFSSFGVLIYYAIANASAYTQTGSHRRWPHALNVAGLIGCLVLVATLPWASIVTGVLMFAIGIGGRALVLRNRSGTAA